MLVYYNSNTMKGRNLVGANTYHHAAFDEK